MIEVRPHATETELPTREELTADYARAIRKGDEQSALEIARQLGSTAADMRPPEQRVHEDLVGLRSYEADLARFREKLAAYADAVAWAETLDAARQWAAEVDRERRRATTYLNAASASLQRLQAFGVKAAEDTKLARLDFEKAVAAAREKIDRAYGLLVCDDVLLPVKREVPDGKKH